MSIAEKLTTVAENQQKVYDAGHKAAVNRYCPDFIETDSIVTCKPVGGYPLGIISQITPIQAGSGDASPTNVRPITAHTAVKVTRCGVNMIDLTRFLDANWAVGEDGAYFGKPTDLYAKFGENKGGFLSGCFKPNTRYTIKSYARHDAVSETTVVTAQAGIKYTDGTSTNFQFCQSNEYKEVTVVTSANKTVASISFTYSGNATSYVKSMTMCEGTVATDEPYKGDIFTAQFGQEAYCGSFDWSTGLLTLTHKMQTLTGEEGNWVKYSSWAILNHVYLSDSRQGTATLYGYCSHVGTASNGSIDYKYIRKANTAKGYEILTLDWGLPDNEIATWTNFLKEQMLNGTPVQVLYQLEVPITIQLTPQEILALSGTNTIQSDTGNTTVTGKGDGVAMVEELKDIIISLGGEV